MNRTGAFLTCLGLAVLITSVTFPLWSLSAYSVGASSADPPDESATVLEFEELPPESQRAVERAIEREDGVTVYGPSAREAVPVLGSNTVYHGVAGAYVRYEGAYYSVRISRPSPFYPMFVEFPLVVAGVALGLLVSATGAVTASSDIPPVYLSGVVFLGIVALLGVGLGGNVHGYVWPIQ